MIENRQAIASILDDCARLMELWSAEHDAAQTAYMIGYVGGRLAAAAAAVREGDSRELEVIATALDRKVTEVQQP